MDLLVLVENPKYKANSKIHCPTNAGTFCNCQMSMGVIIKKREPIKEYGTEFVNFFNILKEKNN